MNISGLGALPEQTGNGRKMTHSSTIWSNGRRPTHPSAAVSLDQPGVVVVGAGFGGIEVGKSLQRARTHLTIIDRKNYTLFQPLLYQVATAALSPGDVAVPIRSLLRSPNTEVLLDDVLGVDAKASRVRTVSSGEIPFKFLVLATGSQYNYFGHQAWQKLAPNPKSLDDALAIRRSPPSRF